MPAAGTVEVGVVPYWGGVGLGGLGGVSQSGSEGRCDEVRVEAAVGRRAACVGTGWSAEAVTAALAMVEVT